MQQSSPYHYPEPANYRWKGGLIIDNFAGGGGASTGISQAIGRSPDIAVNHNVEALMMHEENHPTTRHYNESVWDIDIRKATGGAPVLMGWFSPDCTHFSVAKGGKPVKKAIRGLAWIVKKWYGQSDMAILKMENVVEFMTWGPLIAKRCKVTKRVIKLVPDGKDKKGEDKFKEVVCEPGEYVAYRDQALVPDKKRAGKTFRQFVKQMREAGYAVEWTVKGMVASDFGDPTTRKRFFLMARKDGLPITWPAATHGSPRLVAANPGKLQPWKTAGDNLDWSIPCPSIFNRKKPLADNTLRRIFKGIEKFVIGAGDNAFLVKTNHGGNEFRGQSADEPLQTITSKLGTGVAAVSLTKFNENSIGQAADQPLDTVMAGATRFGAVQAELQVVKDLDQAMHAGFIATIDHTSNKNPATGMDEPIPTVTSKARHIHVAALLKHYTGVVGQTLDKPLPTITATDHNSVLEVTAMHVQRDFGASIGSRLCEPLGAITAGGGGHAAIIASSLVKLKGSCNHGQALDRPIDTIAAQGNHYAAVQTFLEEQSFLVKFYGTGGAVTCEAPLDTITSKGRFGLVTIQGIDYQIVDIGMRMLEPHELFSCQGFPADYRHEVVMGKKLPKHAQVRMVGNSVPPGLARALVQANIPKWALERKQAAVA